MQVFVPETLAPCGAGKGSKGPPFPRAASTLAHPRAPERSPDTTTDMAGPAYRIRSGLLQKILTRRLDGCGEMSWQAHDRRGPPTLTLPRVRVEEDGFPVSPRPAKRGDGPRVRGLHWRPFGRKKLQGMRPFQPSMPRTGEPAVARWVRPRRSVMVDLGSMPSRWRTVAWRSGGETGRSTTWAARSSVAP
jgi:hypothetical protein